SFAVQNDHARRLASMISQSHPKLPQFEEGYERVFSKAYDLLTADEKELHAIIRSITVNSLRPTNQSLLEWLRRDTHFRAQRPGKGVLGQLAHKLAALEAHLILWHAKYEAWIPDTPQHALVYLADEEAHGIGFPSGIDALVDQNLSQSGT